MKTMRNLFLLCAGLSLFACSSDDDATQQFLEGTGALTVKVSLPTSRAAVTPSYTETAGEEVVPLEGTIYVKLTAESIADGQGGTVSEMVKSVQVVDDVLQPVKFYGITNPSKVEAWVNGGKTVYDLNNDGNTGNDVNITAKYESGDEEVDYNMQATATKVPAYEGVDITENHRTNKSEVYEGTSYQMYEVDVPMEILVARIEYAVSYDFSTSDFATLNFQGAYLDNIKATPSTDAGENSVNWDYRHSLDVTNQGGYETTATGAEAILGDDPVSPISFPNQTSVLPESDKVYAYNIYPGTVPHFKLFFNGATSREENEQAVAYVVPYQYAVVNSYKSNSVSLTAEDFKAGVIYRVASLANPLVLEADNLATGEDGNNGEVQFGIEVTVVQASWDVQDVDGSWSQN